MQQKRLVTIQDLSCFGKCSSSVALSVISSLGTEAVVLPTAILSTHTGGFSGYSFYPLLSEFKKIEAHWESLSLNFDCIYVGYIGSSEMIDAVSDFIDKFRNGATVFIDPAMADDGAFYSGLDMNYAKKLSALLKKADIICPNITEALILSGKKPNDTYDESIFKSLSLLSENVIVTGINDKDMVSTAVYGCGEVKTFSAARRKGPFYGSGDLFASAFIGMYINGLTLDESVKNAVEFVSDCIEKTIDEREKYSYGLKFEQSLSILSDIYRQKIYKD